MPTKKALDKPTVSLQIFDDTQERAMGAYMSQIIYKA